MRAAAGCVASPSQMCHSTHHQMNMDGVDPATTCLQVPQLDGVLAHVLQQMHVYLYQQPADENTGMTSPAHKRMVHLLDTSCPLSVLRGLQAAPQLAAKMRNAIDSSINSRHIRCEVCQGSCHPCSPTLCNPPSAACQNTNKFDDATSIL